MKDKNKPLVGLAAVGATIAGYLWYKKKNKTVGGLSEGEPFICECINCGYELATQKHCKRKTCPKCSGQMKRKYRPGRGRGSGDKNPAQDAIRKQMRTRP